MAETTSTRFSRTTTVQISIRATPEIVWALLTNASDFPRWNSTITSIEGTIAEGQRVKLKTTLDPKRTFALKVVDIDAPASMTWKSGQTPFFSGIRTYIVDRKPDGATQFTMSERLAGIMFPLAAGQIPDFGESFERYASDLKSEAELVMRSKK